MGAVFGFGFDGGWDFDPSDVDMDDDELSLVEAIIVPVRKVLEDFWGAESGGADTTTSTGGEEIDGLPSVRRRLGCVASDV